MTTDNEQHRAWREAVRAFRLAVTALEDPAPGLFANLSVEEGLQGLMQEVPLVSFSPFDVLPDGVLAGSDGRPHPPGDDSGRGSYPAVGRRATPDGAGLPQTSGPSRPPRGIPGAALPQDHDPAVRPPVFSFRRSVPAAQRQPLQRSHTREDPTEEAKSTAYMGHSSVPGPTPEDQQREGPGAGDTWLDPPSAVSPGAATDGRDLELDREADDHGPGKHSSSYPIAPDGLADSFLKAARGRVPDLPVVGLYDPNHEAYGSSAIALIAALAEHLLVPRAQFSGSLPASGARDGGVVARSVPAHVWERPEEEAVLDRPALALSDGADGEPAGRLPSGSDRTDLGGQSIEVAPDRYMDAEIFAAFVNDVLVRQARRHGVDLS